MQRRFALAGAGLLAASVMLLPGLFARDESKEVAGEGSPTVSRAPSVGHPAPAPAQDRPAFAASNRANALPAVLPIVTTAPPKMLVGETGDIVVTLGANAGVGEIAFTVQFDPNVLQVRGGTEGEWTTAGKARFSAEVSSTEDRVQVRSTIAGRPAAGAGGSVALVQFQAVAPGGTAVMVSDVRVTDAAGQALPFALSPSNVPVLVESLPQHP